MAFIAFGTQVYARKDGSVVIAPPESNYQPAADELRIAEVVNIHMEMNVGEITKATIECYPQQDTILVARRADYRFKKNHNGEAQKISFVRFEDGSTWYPEEAKDDQDLLHKFMGASENLPEIVDPPNNGRPRKIDGELKTAMD